MKKKTKIIFGLIIILFLTYISIFWIQNNLLKNELRVYWIDDQNDKFQILEHDMVRCNYNIFNPTLAFVSKSEVLNKYIDWEVFFYDSKNIFSQTNKEWGNSYIGGTTVFNIAFENLVEMVREDCYQFQETNFNGNKEELYWTWNKYIDYSKTPEEIEQERIEDEERKRKIESGEIILDTRTPEEILKDIEERDKKIQWE